MFGFLPASNSRVTVTLASGVSTGDFSIGAVIAADSAGQNSLGAIFRDTGLNFRVETAGSGGTVLTLVQGSGTAVDAISTSSASFNVGAAYVVGATFRESDGLCRLYRGIVGSEVAEMSYTTQQALTGTRVAVGTTCYIGNGSALTRCFDGSIGHVFFSAREWNLAEFREFGHGKQPVQDGSLRGYWPMDHRNTATCPDNSGQGAAGTTSNVTVVKEPAILWRL